MNPETGKPYRLDFPELCVEDIGKAAHMLITQLGIDQLCTMVGPSMGGMSCTCLSAAEPKRRTAFSDHIEFLKRGAVQYCRTLPAT